MSRKRKGEQQRWGAGRGSAAGQAEAGAAEGPWGPVSRKRDRWLWVVGAEDAEMTLGSWQQPQWALMRTEEKHVCGLRRQGGGFEASVGRPSQGWRHVFAPVLCREGWGLQRSGQQMYCPGRWCRGRRRGLRAEQERQKKKDSRALYP